MSKELKKALENQTAKSTVPSSVQLKNPLTRKSATSKALPYANQFQTVRKLERAILKITPSSSVRELEGYKAEMHRLFNFIEEEKGNLDRSAECSGHKLMTATLQREELALSDEIDKLKSEALMASVEADLQIDQTVNLEEEKLREGGSERLYYCYKRYNHLLEALLKRCRAYKTILGVDATPTPQ